MKVRFLKTGTVVDFVAADWLFAFVEAGLVEEIKETKVKAVRSNAARWWAEGLRKNACIVVVCDSCRQQARWHEANATVKLEHCGKTEVVPKEVFENYKKARNTW
jgi:hypothetical protein